VERLAAGVREHAPGVDFWCLTDTVVPGVECVPLVRDWPGWWAKINLFSPALDMGGRRYAYFDLDTLVLGDLSDLFSYEGEFAMLSDFYRPEIPASGVMLFRPGAITERLWAAFTADPERIMRRHRRSDHWYATQCEPDRLQDLYPGRIASLKLHCRRERPGDGVSVVCGHGRPRLDQPAAGWAYTEWRGLAGAVAA
jgi:hypothetical protein